MKYLSRFIFLCLGLLAPVSTVHAQVGLDFLNLPPDAKIGEILGRLYVFAVSIAVILALIMFVVGGVQYMVGGDKDPGPAKERMKNALFGLIVALTSWLILYTINPALVQTVKLEPVLINLERPPTERARENEPCIGESSNESELCTSGLTCFNASCLVAKINQQGLCKTSCGPPRTTGELGSSCGAPENCKSGLICFNTDNKQCKRVPPAVGGTCLYANCKNTQ